LGLPAVSQAPWRFTTMLCRFTWRVYDAKQIEEFPRSVSRWSPGKYSVGEQLYLIERMYISQIFKTNIKFVRKQKRTLLRVEWIANSESMWQTIRRTCSTIVLSNNKKSFHLLFLFF
jgi:hypothetical protein